jgi:hypothetical protein
MAHTAGAPSSGAPAAYRPVAPGLDCFLAAFPETLPYLRDERNQRPQLLQRLCDDYPLRSLVRLRVEFGRFVSEAQQHTPFVSITDMAQLQRHMRVMDFLVKASQLVDNEIDTYL